MFEFIYESNPWWEQEVAIPEFKRWHFYDILDDVKKIREAHVELIIGMRRTGKTTILLQLAKELHSKNYSIVYIPVDELLVRKVGSLRDVIDFFMKNIRESDKTIILLDEIQFYDNWAIEIKTLIDNFRRRNEPVKVIATGSSSLGITIGAGEALVGRTNIRYINPFSPLEAYAFLHDEKKLVEKLYEKSRNLTTLFVKGKFFDIAKEIYSAFGTKTINRLHRNIKEFLVYGTLPEVLELVKNKANLYDIKKKLSEILDLTLLRDILRIQYLYPSRYRIDAEEAQLITKTVISKSPIQTSYTDLSNKIRITKEKIKLALNLARYAGLIEIVQPYTKDPLVRAKKSRFKVFTTDNGLKNHLMTLDAMTILKNENILGPLFENFMLSRLLSTIRTITGLSAGIYYWYIKKGTKTFEVDAVIKLNHKRFAFEYKLREKMSKGLNKLLEYDRDAMGYILSFDNIEKLLPFMLF